VTEITPDIAVVDQLIADAKTAVAENPPSRVLATVMLFLLMLVPWVIGRLWYFLALPAAFAFGAVVHGYRKGAKIPVKPKNSQPPQQ
jgi:uncharacterized membrane protein AbrB (regulator of aidB expression)